MEILIRSHRRCISRLHIGCLRRLRIATVAVTENQMQTSNKKITEAQTVPKTIQNIKQKSEERQFCTIPQSQNDSAQKSWYSIQKCMEKDTDRALRTREIILIRKN